jgi:glycerol-3-phosphate acyltransferase PlsY
VFAIIPAMLLDMPYWVMGACGTLAVIGHVFPIWLKGKGGKGVATTLAVYWTLYWPLGLVASLSWLLCAYVTRISSLSALVAMVVTMVMSFFFGPSAYIIVTIILGVIVIYRHKSNIKNIIKGSEPTIGKTCE